MLKGARDAERCAGRCKVCGMLQGVRGAERCAGRQKVRGTLRSARDAPDAAAREGRARARGPRRRGHLALAPGLSTAAHFSSSCARVSRTTRARDAERCAGCWSARDAACVWGRRTVADVASWLRMLLHCRIIRAARVCSPGVWKLSSARTAPGRHLPWWSSRGGVSDEGR